ncbi:MAG: DNA mismatch repair endonuclease MutL [Thermoplasmata archaeon]
MSPPAARAPIVRLDPATVQRIAAGEVVDRPASVVKELVENAVDAGATAVVVRLLRGGLDRIEVADNGIGILPEELPLALERHATSKLGPGMGLERIGTLGFRGEALASIASVARFRISSRPPGFPSAHGLARDGEGGPVRAFEEGRDVGTTVEVADLFFQTPARRKFLRAAAAEQLEVLRTVERLYLARPSVALRLEAEGRSVADYPATDDLVEAAARVLGPELRESSVLLDAELPPSGQVRGVLGRPSLSHPSARRLHLVVNGRAIESRTIAQAVRAAYVEYMPRTRYPVGLLHLSLPLDRVDVNVHPAKREIRVVGEGELIEAIRQAVRRALLGQPAPARPPVAWGRPSSPAPPAPAGSASGAGPWRPAGGPAPPAPGVRPLARVRPLIAEAVPPRSAHAGPSAGRLGGIALLGCLDALYWVGTVPGGFVLVDQHAASERLLYERILSQGKLGRQRLVDPRILRLTAGEASALAAHADAVREAGFEVEPFGGEQVRLVAVPSYRGQTARAESLREMLAELSGGGRPTVPDGLSQRTAASIACHAAIRAGDPVAPETLGRILAELDTLALAGYSCPHGRPILHEIPRSRLDRWFLRTGVGP